jgi:hypothetical protein
MYEEAGPDVGFVSDGDAQGLLARAEAAISKICGEDSAYTSRMRAVLDAGILPSLLRDLRQ